MEDHITPDESQLEPPPKQPLIARRMIVRGVIALVFLGVLLLAINVIRAVQDVDLPAQADTAGMIAAIKTEPNGDSKAILIGRDGRIETNPGYTPGAKDRELTWRPDGNRLFFASDREGKEFHVFRWNPASKRVERRSAEGGTYSHFAFPRSAKGASSMLVERGGRLFEFDPSRGVTMPVLPPASGEPTQGGSLDESGAGSAFEAMYGRLNATSIREGRWVKGKRWIAAVLRREQGEVLILQDLEKPASGVQPFAPPLVVVAGDRVEFDVNDTSGEVVFSVLGFQFPGDPPPEAIKDGKVVLPFRSVVGLVDPEDGFPRPIIGSNDNANAFASPVVSPDGSMILIRRGRYLGEGDFEPQGLVSAPARQGAASAGALILRGLVLQASWSPDGRQIVYLGPSGQTRSSIHLMNSDGSNDVVVAEGEFASAAMSPQIATAER